MTIIKTNGKDITEQKTVNCRWTNYIAEKIEASNSGDFYYAFVLHYSSGNVVYKEYGNKGDIKLVGNL